jgi:hypothetical protein
LLKRNISTATGVDASTTPATSAAGDEYQRRTVTYRSATLPTPISASGTSMLQVLNPNSRADRPMTHNEAGVLSTVMKLDASNEPKNQAFQLCEPACTAAA